MGGSHPVGESRKPPTPRIRSAKLDAILSKVQRRGQIARAMSDLLGVINPVKNWGRLGRLLGQLAMYFDAPLLRWRLLICQVRPIRRKRLEVAVMNHDRAKQLVAEAKKIARQAESWISLSNALSDPQGGS